MKALIPSHREDKRYLLIQGKDLKKNVLPAIKKFIGNLGISEASPRWIKVDSNKGILSINRNMINKVRASFALFDKKIEIIKISGTIKGLTSKK